LLNDFRNKSPEEIQKVLDEMDLSVEELQQMEEFLRPESRVIWDPRFCIENYFYIKDKQKRLILLKFNTPQLDFFSKRTTRNVIIKPRQLGFSTLIIALNFWDTLVHPYVTSVTVSHDYDATERLFRIVQRLYDHLPSFLRKPTSIANRRAFEFKESDSTFFINTSMKIVSGRGDTIHNGHFSEVAFWPNAAEVMPALLEAVPMSGYADLECSPEGRINRYFQQFWDESKQGMNGYKNFFYPWWTGDEYRMPLEKGEQLPLTAEDKRMMKKNNLTKEQMKFYLRKRAVLKQNIHREYPSDDLRAFLFAGEGFFDNELLLTIIRDSDFEPYILNDDGVKIFEMPQQGKRYVIGGDSAKGIGGGTSRSALEVLDVEGCEQVAEYIGRITPPQFGRIAASLGHFYNDALIAIESNHPGPSTLNTLMNEENYSNLYWYTDFSKKSLNEKQPGQAGGGQVGYPTNEKTRPVYLLHLKEMLEFELLRINSVEFLTKCCEFLLDDNGRPSGKGDDPIIAMGIALQIRKEAGSSFEELLDEATNLNQGRTRNAFAAFSSTAQILQEGREGLRRIHGSYFHG